MAHNNRIRPALGWVALSVWDPAECELADQYTFEAVNGDQGGTWAPAATIQIGGAGITLDTWLHGNWTATGSPHFSGGVPHFVSGATFTAPPTFDFGFSVSAAGIVTLGVGAAITGPDATARLANVTVDDEVGYRLAGTTLFDTYVDLVPVYEDTEWATHLVNTEKVYSAVGVSKSFCVPIRVPFGANITEIHVTVDGNGGGTSHVDLPVTLPHIELYRRTDVATAPVMVSTAADTSATLAAYQTLHTVDMMGLAENVVGGSYYWVRVYGEEGLNALGGCLAVYGIRVRWNHSRMCQART